MRHLRKPLWIAVALVLGLWFATPGWAGVLSPGGTAGGVSHGSIAALNGVANYTVMGWFFFEQVSINDTVFAGPENFFVVTPASDWRFSGSGAGGSPSVVPPPTKEWVHITFRFDGAGATNDDKCQVFYNGLRQNASFLNNCTGTVATATFEIFGDSNSGGAFIQGHAAHIKAWNATLSVDAILAEMWSAHPLRTANLQLWAPYDGGVQASVPSLYDLSGNGNHGTPEAGMLEGEAPPVSY